MFGFHDFWIPHGRWSQEKNLWYFIKRENQQNKPNKIKLNKQKKQNKFDQTKQANQNENETK